MKEKVLLVFSAMRDKRTPWYAKLLLGVVLAYIISPIDIIPDFIPVIGLLDEVILVPVAFAFIYKFIPESVKQDQVASEMDDVSKNRLIITGILIVVSIWTIFSLLLYTFYQNMN